MRKYLNEIFGLNAKIENWNGKSKLPLYLKNKRDYFVLSIGDVQSVLMKNDSETFNVSSFEKEMQQIEKYVEMPVILWLDAVSTYQRNALIKNKISFIVPNSQIYIPELGISLKEFCAGKKEKVEKISAVAQFLLLYFIYQKENEGKKQSELAEYLDTSDMNISRAVQELKGLGLLEINKDGTSKLIRSIALGKELYQHSEEYLQSPVQKKIYVSSAYVNMELPFAGETALAKQSMLNYPKHMVYAMDKKLAKDIPKNAIVEPNLMADSDYVEIELWKYNPMAFASDGVVDIVSLVQSLKEVEDERVEMQIEEIMEEYRW